ncbi:hypothetical protein LuPra_05465 [Luteitalea pratensis]|uniref:Uncharacterized protein n=1 Tax=Luteitalea pratensis TaxID=1855912 RepID=A0A143PUD4_LUTPR|nr:hypothetical protein LuPra_05465 [Luteitalea pratensis]
MLVDRLVAIVGEQALTWRDVEAARLLGSVPAGGTSADGVERLVTRELMHIEVERLAVVAPMPALVEERLDRARQRAGGPGAFTLALQSLGLTELEAREWVADDLRMEVYVDQRFTAPAQPTDVEVAAAAVREGAREPSPDQLREARRRIVEARRAALVADWLAGIRERTSVQIAGGR